MIVTIDGPAGAGKSSAARELARRLGFRFLDTGAMYRAVTLAAKERGLDLADADRLAQLVGEIRVELDGDHVLLDGRDVTKEIRTFDITTSIQYAADNPAVRAQLVNWQREAAAGRDVVTEGRDQGTVVFPARRVQNLSHGRRSTSGPSAATAISSAAASKSPSTKCSTPSTTATSATAPAPSARCVKADDAIEVSTNGLSPAEVVARLEEIVRSKQ